MMTRRNLNVGPRRSFARLLRNHIRLLVTACVTSLLAAVILLVPSTEGAAPPVFAGEPVNLVVTANSNTSITLGWTAPAGGAAHYRVERSESVFGPFGFIGTAATTSFNDTTVTIQRAYLYRVRAVLTNGCQSEPGNMALGTAIAFEFNQLATQQIKAQHFHDVRTAINAVRAVANLSPAGWARPTLNNLPIRAADVLELRNRLNEALEVLDIPVGLYTDPILSTGATGTLVKAIHIEQLQARSTRGVRSDPYTIEISQLGRAQIGEFSSATTLPLVPVHLSVLPDGRILFWGRDKDRVAGGTSFGTTKEIAGKSEAYVWNLAEGSNKADIAVFRPSERNWYIINSSTGQTRIVQWGAPGDTSAPGDYDGDGRADIAVFRPSNAQWDIIKSSGGSPISIIFGIGGDVPVPADYDQDGTTDIAIYRPSNGLWGIRFSAGGPDLTTGWGIPGDIPVPADYDRDRRTDIAVFRPSENTWYIRKSTDTTNPLIRQWGTNGDVPAPGDFNGDGTADLAVYRPSDGNWYIRNLASIPESSQTLFLGTSSGATVAPADFDGDGKTDPAIFRGSQGNWLIRRSTNGSIQTQSWGQNGDVPVPKDFDGMLRVFNSTTNLFCSGHSFLSDGRLMVSGGHKSPDEDAFGEPHTNIFDFRSNKWVRGPEMNKGRWYPYNVTLNNGETLIISGADTPQTINNVPQIFGSCNRDLNSPNLTVSTYPFLHLMPDGRVLMVQSGPGNDKRSRVLDPFAFPSPSPTPTPNPPKPGVWKSYPSTKQEHWTGSSVMFDSGRKVLVMGGFNANNQPLSGAEYIDLTVPDAQAAWTEIPSMKFPRTYHTSTILPDGKVLVTGGVKCEGSVDITCGTVLHAEMWDPTANPSCLAQTPWRTMAQHSEVRAYHSIAALLPDGRVLVGGGGLPGAEGEIDLNGIEITDVFDDLAKFHGHKTVEFYSPPYLFDANGNPAVRPLITSAPANVLYGQQFDIATSGAGSTPKVSLMRLASVTHGFNQDQRHIFLTATAIGSTVRINAPGNSNEAPPGHYMLFVMNNGVPSVAKIVRVGNTSMFQTEVPVTHQLGNGQAFEQGFEFSSSVTGQITHIRYWKHPDEPVGNHVGRIWNSSGQQVAAVAFTCETASGWQEAMLTTPLTINAGTRYRVSYNASTVVAKTFGVFDNGPITRGPLTGWAGYFSAGAGQHPATFSGSNLFADVVFKIGQ